MIVSSPVHVQTELAVVVPNEPGALARLTGTLLDAGVNLSGILALHHGASTRVRFLAEPGPEAARRALEHAGYRVSEERVFRLEAPAGSDLQARVIGELAARGINILSGYSEQSGGRSTFVFSVDEPDQAEAILRET